MFGLLFIKREFLLKTYKLKLFCYFVRLLWKQKVQNPDEMPHFAASCLGSYCFRMSNL